MKTRSGKAAGPNLICIPPTMKCSLETGPSPTPTNTEGFPNLPPKIREGGRGLVLYLTHFPKKERKREAYQFRLDMFPLKNDREAIILLIFVLLLRIIQGGERRRSKESYPIYRKIKREEGTGVEPCPQRGSAFF